MMATFGSRFLHRANGVLRSSLGAVATYMVVGAAADAGIVGTVSPRSSVSPAASPSLWWPARWYSVKPVVLVMVGSGNRFVFDGMMGLDARKLLKALANDELYSEALKGVDLDKCEVLVCTSESDEEPTAKQEADAVPLRGAITLEALVASLPPGNVFIRVHLPRGGISATDLPRFRNVTVPPAPERDPVTFALDDVDMFLNAASSSTDRLAALTRMAMAARDAGTLSDSARLPLFSTMSHLSLLHKLVSDTAVLATGRFAGRNGSASTLLVGDGGIGKTNLLRIFVRLCAILFPDVIPVYVTGEGLADADNSFASASLHGVMLAAAEEHGIKADGMAGLIAGLKAKGKKMLIILDEVDQLYRCSSLTEKRLLHNVNATLGKLGYLGGQSSGLFCTMLCGSAAATSRLIVADHTVPQEHYPLVADGVPDLNCTKFRTFVFDAADCTDIKQAETIIFHSQHAQWLPIATVAPENEATERLQVSSVTAFVAGTVPRNIHAALSHVRTDASSSSSSADARSLLSSLFSPPDSLSPDAKEMYVLLCRLLVKANKELVSKCHKQHKGVSDIDVDAIVDGSWAELVHPISLEAVVSAWQEDAASSRGRGAGLVPFADETYVRRQLDDLSDANLIAKRKTWERVDIWPMSAGQVVLLNTDKAGGYAPARYAPVSPLWPWLQRASEASGVVANPVSLADRPALRS